MLFNKSLVWNPYDDFVKTQNALQIMRQNKAKAISDAALAAVSPQLYQNKLLHQQLANKAAQTNLNYLPGKDEATNAGLNLANTLKQLAIKYLPELDEAKINEANVNSLLLHNKLLKSQQPTFDSAMGKALEDQAKINKIYGKNSPQAQAQATYINNLNTLKKGLEVSSTPGGGFTITSGGVQMNPSSLPASGGVSTSLKKNMGIPGVGVGPNGVPSIVQSPAAPASSYTTAGATLIDPKTGKAISVPYSQTGERFQQQIVGAQQSEPILKSIGKNVAPFTGWKGLKNKMQGSIDQFVGKTNWPYTKYQAAVLSGTPAVVEKMVRIYNLHPNAETIKTLTKQFIPRADDTPESYQYRVAYSLANEYIAEKKAQDYSKDGIPLQMDKNGEIDQDAIVNKFYNQLHGASSDEAVKPYKQYSAKEIRSVMRSRNLTYDQVVSLINARGAQ